MATYRVQYVDGYGGANGGDRETLEADGFGLSGDGIWMDFHDGQGAVVLRVRAEHILRIERVLAHQAEAPREPYDPLDEELAG